MSSRRTEESYPGGSPPGDQARIVGTGASPTIGPRGASGTATSPRRAGDVSERVSAAPRTAPAIAAETEPVTLVIEVSPPLAAAPRGPGRSRATSGTRHPRPTRARRGAGSTDPSPLAPVPPRRRGRSEGAAVRRPPDEVECPPHRVRYRVDGRTWSPPSFPRHEQGVRGRVRSPAARASGEGCTARSREPAPTRSSQ